MTSTAPLLPAIIGPATTPDRALTVGPATPDVSVVLDIALTQVEQYVATQKRGRTELSAVRKWVFRLATGQLPPTGPRGAFVWTPVAPAPGWTPVAPAGAQDWMFQRYREELFEAGIIQGTSARDICLLSGFYQWLLNSHDTPVAAYRRRYKPSTPARGSSGQDRFYSAQHSARLLAAVAERVCEARGNARQPRGAAALQRAQVDELVAWLLWGTGASAEALCALNITDIDLQAMTITWRTTPEDGASPVDIDSVDDGSDDDSEDDSDDDSDDDDQGREDGVVRVSAGQPARARRRPVRVQPLPPALVEVLRAYLRDVRPTLDEADGRLLVNPHGQGDNKHWTARTVQRTTRDLAEQVELMSLPGAHNPKRWRQAYAMRILEAPRGSMIALMKLEDRSAYVGLERLYSTPQPDLDAVSIEDVFGPAQRAR